MGKEIDYGAVLADLEARRAAIDSAISGVKAMMGQMPADAAPVGAGGALPGVHGDGDLPREVAPGVFHGLSISSAARKFLEMKKAKQKTRTICDAMMQGGIESDARDFYSNVYTTLNRNKDFLKIGKYWALASWYPNRVAAQTTKPARKARRVVKKGQRVRLTKEKAASAELPIVKAAIA